MYAIVDIAGKQFKVTQDQFVYAPLMEGEEGASVEFEKVLLLDNEGKVEVGAPVVKGAKVSGKIIGHVKGDKVIVFKITAMNKLLLLAIIEVLDAYAPQSGRH